MTKGKTKVIQKDPNKGTARNNYRLITCQPMTRKILTAQIRKYIYNSLTIRGLFPEVRKKCRKGFRGTAEIIYMDQQIINESKDQKEKFCYGQE